MTSITVAVHWVLSPSIAAGTAAIFRRQNIPDTCGSTFPVRRYLFGRDLYSSLFYCYLLFYSIILLSVVNRFLVLSTIFLSKFNSLQTVNASRMISSSFATSTNP